MSEIVVLGSFMMDLVARANRLPNNGETLMGNVFLENPGGKGANQAAAIAKLDEQVSFIGMVGEDTFGEEAITVLHDLGVDINNVVKTPEARTGVGCVWVEESGNNRIIIIPGANLKYGEKELIKVKNTIEKAKLLVMQLEMDFDFTVQAIELAYSYGVPVLLNPAPARILPSEVLSKINYLTPNEKELELIVGEPLNSKEDIIQAAKSLIKKGVNNIIVTLGENGAVWVSEDEDVIEVDALRVKAIDTVAAGDSFNGALATAIVNKKSKKEALQFANKVGALTVTKIGAIQSLPTLVEVNNFKNKMVVK